MGMPALTWGAKTENAPLHDCKKHKRRRLDEADEPGRIRSPTNKKHGRAVYHIPPRTSNNLHQGEARQVQAPQSDMGTDLSPFFCGTGWRQSTEPCP